MDKICGICHQDCSDRPRVKDQRGRYFCKACAMAHAGRAGPRAAATAEPDERPYNLDDAEPGASPLPIEMLDHAERSTPCPACMHSMPPGAKVCVACGYHVEKGIQSSTQIEMSKGKGGRKYQCRECGYDLTGLRSGVCPECGTKIRINKKADWDAQTEREVIRAEWTKPAVAGVIGAVAVCAVLNMQGNLDLLPYYGILLTGEVLVGFVILWISFFFLGDLGTPLLNLARLTALYLVVDSIWLLFSSIPGVYIRTGLPALAYVGLFMNFFDVYWEDAAAVLIINWIAKMAILVTAILMFSNYL